MRLLAIVVALSGLTGEAARQARPDPSAADVVDAAAAYVRSYQEELTLILADETYTQQIRAQTPSDPEMPRARTLKSEVFFMFAPSSREWMAIRDVMTVDGKPVEDRPDIRTQLQVLPAAQVGATFKNYNSRFNLGRAFRNFNEPTLSLLVLDPGHRSGFAFERKGVERAGDATVVTVAFSERRSQETLIRDLRLRPVRSKGELMVEAGTGRVRHAVLNLTIGGLQAQLSTTYARDEKLGIWVPTLFREHYEQGVDPSITQARSRTPKSGDHEDVFCEAKYSNFRRFEVTTRIR